MRLITLAVLVLLTSVSFLSCDKCKGVDCVSQPEFRLVMTDKKTGRNVYTDTAMFSKDSLQVMAIVPGGQDIRTRSSVDDEGIISMTTVLGADKYVLLYDAVNTDTFNFSNVIAARTECCGAIIQNYDISHVRTAATCNSCLNKTPAFYR